MKNLYYTVTNALTGEIVANKVKIAQDFKSRSIGLLNRQSLEEGEGLLIKPCNAIHTFFMKFPIDVVFLSRSCEVVKIGRRLPVGRLYGLVWGAYMVLELKAGAVDTLNLNKRDKLKIDKNG